MKVFRIILLNRSFTSALAFAVTFYFFEEWLFNFPQGSLFQIVMTFRPPEEQRITIISSVISFIFTFLFVWVALGSSRLFQGVYVFLFALSCIVQYGFWKAVERFMSSADLRIAAVTPLATWQGAGTLYFNIWFILPVIVFTGMAAMFNKKQPLKINLAGLLSLVIFVATTGIAYTFTDKIPNWGASLPSFYQTLARFTIDNVRPPKRETISYHHPDLPKNNIVLIIDESIRGDHLSINGYKRETTPFLESLNQKGVLYNWGLAVAGATCSHPSNSLILTGVRPSLDEFARTTTYPTIFQYAKGMGYVTYYMDAQTNSFWNGLTGNDVNYLDAWFKAKDLGDDIQSDIRAADLITQIVSEGVGNFIVLNKRGVHFLYEGSYPSNEEIWGPVPSDYHGQPELVTNPYDNGVRYNVNAFFERLYADSQILDHTVVLYTSDHGQTLFENQVSWLHCNYTPQEAIVPMILIGMNISPTNTMYPASHSNILPTLLDLMGVPREEHLHEYAPSLLSPSLDVDPNRFFFDGSLRLIDFPDH